MGIISRCVILFQSPLPNPLKLSFLGARNLWTLFSKHFFFFFLGRHPATAIISSFSIAHSHLQFLGHNQISLHQIELFSYPSASAE